MSEVIKIKKGFDIKLKGEAVQTLTEIPAGHVALKPTDFQGLSLKPAVQEGVMVKAGTPVLFDKIHHEIVITSPVSGVVTAVVRGDKRSLQAIVVSNDGLHDSEDFGKADPAELSREEIISKLLKSGSWPLIRQRPYAIVAGPGEKPAAIYITCFDSAPLAPDMSFIAGRNKEDFRLGIRVLAKLTEGSINLGLAAGHHGNSVFEGIPGVQYHYFRGPHPAGNVGIQIHHVSPVNKGEVLWTLEPQGVVLIGRLFRTGKYDARKIIALTGSELANPSYIQVISGAAVPDMLAHNTLTGNNVRIIGGNVLTGKNIGKEGYLGYYDNQITVIPEGNYSEFFGWALPGLNKLSLSRSFFSWLTPARKYRLNTNLNGGHRAFVITGAFERVFPMKIFPMQLIKAILAEDIELMENLGIYEVAEEDFALVEFVDPSKNEIQSLIRKGLDLVRNEMSE